MGGGGDGGGGSGGMVIPPGGMGGMGGDGGMGGMGGMPPTCDDPCELPPPQCGCDPGKGCTMSATGVKSCKTSGDVPTGGGCSIVDKCMPGGICLGGANYGYCAQFCDEDDQCPGNEICALHLNDGMGGSVPGAAMCSTGCDPGNGAGCPMGMTCVVGQEQEAPMRFFFFCAEAGAGTDGAACPNGQANCAIGYGCYNDGVSDVCFKNCNVNNDQCPGIQFCNALQSQSGQPITVNGYTIGVCQ